ncbi:MAG: biopolymer transporter ExbD [Novosphingobium sp.]|nr:biopolymer transporter ExbD [Novosphingobium sp.]
MAMGVASGGRRGRRGSRRTPMADINVTPLVDVMLVLLIIFMVTAPLLTSAVPVDLPDSRASAMDQEPDQVTITIRADGGIYIDDDPVAPGTFPDRLAAMPVDASGKPPLVTLRADKTLDYGRVMAVMGELNRAGFNAISLVTNSSVNAP